jgi:hypothetical protein
VLDVLVDVPHTGSMTHYHITARTHVEAILAEGLRTDAEGWDTGYIWFFDCLEVARQAAVGTWGGHRDLVILAVDTTGLAVIPDPHPGWGDDRDHHAFAVASHVSPDRVAVTN